MGTVGIRVEDRTTVAKYKTLLERGRKRAFKRALDLRWRVSPPDYDRTFRLKVNGFDIVVLPSVFHPNWHFTSLFLAQACETLVKQKGLSVLEVGTGTGLVALSAARQGADVSATDINPTAVRCARLNAISNGLAAQVRVFEGDMFAPVAGQRFSLILCNPPYFAGHARNDADLAYRGGPNLEWLSKFAQEARAHLDVHGKLVCVLGDAADVQGLVGRITAEGWEPTCIERRSLPTEQLSLWQFMPLA